MEHLTDSSLFGYLLTASVAKLSTKYLKENKIANNIGNSTPIQEMVHQRLFRHNHKSG